MTHKYVNSKIQQAFDVAMLGRQYGEEERQHAFAWFAEGWQRAMTAPAHDEVEPTPRTDRFIIGMCLEISGGWTAAIEELAEFARGLERELNKRKK